MPPDGPDPINEPVKMPPPLFNRQRTAPERDWAISPTPLPISTAAAQRLTNSQAADILAQHVAAAIFVCGEDDDDPRNTTPPFEARLSFSGKATTYGFEPVLKHCLVYEPATGGGPGPTAAAEAVHARIYRAHAAVLVKRPRDNQEIVRYAAEILNKIAATEACVAQVKRAKVLARRDEWLELERNLLRLSADSQDIQLEILLASGFDYSTQAQLQCFTDYCVNEAEARRPPADTSAAAAAKQSRAAANAEAYHRDWESRTGSCVGLPRIIGGKALELPGTGRSCLADPSTCDLIAELYGLLQERRGLLVVAELQLRRAIAGDDDRYAARHHADFEERLALRRDNEGAIATALVSNTFSDDLLPAGFISLHGVDPVRYIHEQSDIVYTVGEAALATWAANNLGMPVIVFDPAALSLTTLSGIRRCPLAAGLLVTGRPPAIFNHLNENVAIAIGQEPPFSVWNGKLGGSTSNRPASASAEQDDDILRTIVTYDVVRASTPNAPPMDVCPSALSSDRSVTEAHLRAITARPFATSKWDFDRNDSGQVASLYADLQALELLETFDTLSTAVSNQHRGLEWIHNSFFGELLLHLEALGNYGPAAPQHGEPIPLGITLKEFKVHIQWADIQSKTARQLQSIQAADDLAAKGNLNAGSVTPPSLTSLAIRALTKVNIKSTARGDPELGTIYDFISDLPDEVKYTFTRSVLRATQADVWTRAWLSLGLLPLTFPQKLGPYALLALEVGTTVDANLLDPLPAPELRGMLATITDICGDRVTVTFLSAATAERAAGSTQITYNRDCVVPLSVALAISLRRDELRRLTRGRRYIPTPELDGIFNSLSVLDMRLVGNLPVHALAEGDIPNTQSRFLRFLATSRAHPDLGESDARQQTNRLDLSDSEIAASVGPGSWDAPPLGYEAPDADHLSHGLDLLFSAAGRRRRAVRRLAETSARRRGRFIPDLAAALESSSEFTLPVSSDDDVSWTDSSSDGTFGGTDDDTE